MEMLTSFAGDCKPCEHACGGPGTLEGLLRPGCLCSRNPACMDMCSKCYRERAAEDERTAANGKAAAAALNSSRMDIGKAGSPVLPAPRPAAVSVPAPEERAAQAKPAVEEAPEEGSQAVSTCTPGEGGEQRPVQQNPGRCFSCNKRVGLTGFKCRCDYVFCSTHRCVLLTALR